MPSFCQKSLDNLESCHSDLQRLFNEVVKGFDCSVICGHRGEEEQNEAFKHNRSTKKFPDSKHNIKPSIAVDVVPYPIDWGNLKRFYLFIGYVRKTAEIMGIKVRNGGDWDNDTMLNDQAFNDLPHWELIL